MASVINAVCNQMKADIVAATDVITCTVGYIDSSHDQWPYAYLILDPAALNADINNTRDAEYPATIGVYTTSFDATNEILEALMELWESGSYRAGLSAVRAINLTATEMHPGAMVPDVENDRGFYGEIKFTLTVRHNF